MTDRWRTVTRVERADFYADWLAASERNASIAERSPIVARGKDLVWTDTANEDRLAMMIGEQVGFPTNGTNLCKAIVPAGRHTGLHRHGEEAIHVVSGEGAILVGGRRYDIRTGTTVHVPYFEEHRVVNLGDGDLEYVSASTIDLDLFIRLGRLEQLEPKGDNSASFLGALPEEAGQLDRLGRRIALHLEDAPQEDERHRKRQAEHEGRTHGHDRDRHGDAKDHGHGEGTDHGGHGEATASGARLIKSTHAHRHGAIYILMGGGESSSDIRNGFTAVSVAMTQIFEEVPHSSSHDHSHTEAVLYALEGVGFSEIDGVHYDWEAGDAVQIPPKMTRHEHFNPSDSRTRTLRIEYGIRYFYEQLWPGYFKVEHRESAVERP